jgi:uncharacterized protein YkwD
MIKKDGAIYKLTSYTLVLLIVFILAAPASSYALSITKENVIDLTNKSRLENGVSAVIEHPALTKAAQNKADDMIMRQYWAHYYNGQKPWDWMKDAGYEYIQAGENLAIDFTDAKTMNQAWLDSESHRANMLNGNYQHIGIGIASGWFKDHNTIIVVQMFGRTNEKIDKAKQDVFSSKVEVSGDNLNFGTEEVAVSQNTIADRLRNILASIGSNVSRVFSFAKQVADNSLGWVNNQLLSGYHVFAD